ncbi:MAG: DNA replication and repair protein RecF [Ignavibacteriaceae bacterium]|nr:DNA replication and repair protein RecF [Ignavibacteriaceae bacterium]
MIVNSLRLKNFRIHKNSIFNFSEKLNFIVGGNGQGKTTILESIYLICTTKSFKSSSDSELAGFESEGYEVSATVSEKTESDVKVIYLRDEKKKRYLRDSKNITRISDIIGKFPVVLLTPADSEITHGYATERRRLIDSIISQSSELYFEILMDYSKTVKQRAALLNMIREKRLSYLFDELDAWDEKLVKEGMELMKYREKFLTGFNEYVTDAFRQVVELKETPVIRYDSIYVNGYDTPEKFSELLKKNRDKEIYRGVNLYGPHRDEFLFYLNDKLLKSYGSQGQHKTFQVALRFAQFFYLKQILNRTPVFLLDDVFGELDQNRSVKISSFLSEIGQAFITLTDFSNYQSLVSDTGNSCFNIEEGKIRA